MRYLLLFIGFLLSIFIFKACVMENPFSALAPGSWRAVLYLTPKTGPKEFQPRKRTEDFSHKETPDGALPFTFDVIYTDKDNFYIDIINGEERIKVEDIDFRHSKGTDKDTVYINFPHYDSYIKAIYDERVMEGYWIVTNRENYMIEFVAIHGNNHRFTTVKEKTAMDVTGKWDVMFGLDEEEPWPAIGEFKQQENKVSGTFLTETGDFRYLDGNIQGNKMFLSCFDGSHAFLFESKILDDKSMIGTFRSGSHYKTTWKGKQDPQASLVSPDSLTYIKDGYKEFNFSFPDLEDQMVSLSDERFQGKAKIVQILGTWCPNCADETAFLSEFYKKNKEHIEVIGLAFEKHKDPAKSKQAIQQFKSRFDVQYEVLLANGSSSKKEASDLLPMLNKVISYPTMIFIDKNNKVRKIHTGFAGPATSEYANFIKDFNTFTTALIKE